MVAIVLFVIIVMMLLMVMMVAALWQWWLWQWFWWWWYDGGDTMVMAMMVAALCQWWLWQWCLCYDGDDTIVMIQWWWWWRWRWRWWYWWWWWLWYKSVPCCCIVNREKRWLGIDVIIHINCENFLSEVKKERKLRKRFRREKFGVLEFFSTGQEAREVFKYVFALTSLFSAGTQRVFSGLYLRLKALLRRRYTFL